MTINPTVVFNIFWLVGLAIILAAFSYSDWLAAQTGVKLRQQLNAPAFQIPLSTGLLLVSLSLALLADAWWERLIWLVFMALFGWQLWDLRSEIGAK